MVARKNAIHPAQKYNCVYKRAKKIKGIFKRGKGNAKKEKRKEQKNGKARGK